MRICFYNLTAGIKSGGLETYCWEAGRALARQGHQVTLMVGRGSAAARHAEVEVVALPFVERQRFPNLGTRFRKLSERLSIVRHAMPRLLGGNYDAIIVNKPYDFPALWYARRAGFTGVTALHSGGTDFYFSDRWFVSAVDLLLSTSAFNAAQVEARYRRPVAIVYKGVDSEVFAPAARDPALRMRFGVPAGAPLIVSVGRLIGLKGLATVIEQLPALAGAHFLAVGPGPERERLERLGADLGVADRLHFAGEVPHADLPAYLNVCDIFVQPTVGEEAFGISVLEAMACSLPVLASDQGGLREIVRHGECGYLLPVRDRIAWQGALAELCDDPERARQFGRAARARVEAHFTWSATAAHLAMLLQRRGTA